ncbi:hypothetical protein [Bacillus pumilus]|uniref:hypothetical protein n=1 Tax=Bacillus pumilus TaxID=1408 RepID=UPI00119CDBF9|nr:hypothetical protein [Bacillus pumilus]
MVKYLTPDYIPGNYSFDSDFTVVGFEVGVEYSLVIEFKGPDGDLIFRTGEEKIKNDNTDEGQENHWGIAINFEYKNVPMDKEGLYTTTVYSNNELLGTFAIPILRKGDKHE